MLPSILNVQGQFAALLSDVIDVTWTCTVMYHILHSAYTMHCKAIDMHSVTYILNELSGKYAYLQRQLENYNSGSLKVHAGAIRQSVKMRD